MKKFIPDIPINKWINVIIRVDEQHKLDAYINEDWLNVYFRWHTKTKLWRCLSSMNGGYGYTFKIF